MGRRRINLAKCGQRKYILSPVEVWDLSGSVCISIAYDAENRQTRETNALGNPSAQYFYDGAGSRVEKVVGGTTTVYAYDALGQLAAEYTNSPGGTPPCQTCYLTYDQLGSTRLVTDENANIVSFHDYLPFGEEVPGGAAGAADSLAGPN